MSTIVIDDLPKIPNVYKCRNKNIATMRNYVQREGIVIFPYLNLHLISVHFCEFKNIIFTDQLIYI